MSMKVFLAVAMSFLLLSSCQDSNQRIIPGSSGNLNNLLVVVDNMLWDESVGESVRDLMAAPVVALNQEEPLFSINQMPPQVFSDFATKNRIILKIEKGTAANMVVKHDVYARPQTVVVVSGMTNAEIKEELETNYKAIVKAFKNEELKEKQRRIALSLHDDSMLKSKLGIELKFPTAYRLAKQEDDFFWIRKDITTGTMDLMIYEVPLKAIKKGDSATMDIVRMRDSIGEVHIPGPVEGSYMITEEAYAPFLFETTIDGKPALETKGLWDVKNAFMSGPFINYAIEDTVNNRYLVIEGYVFAPSLEKRDYVFELEAIIKTLKFK